MVINDNREVQSVGSTASYVFGVSWTFRYRLRSDQFYHPRQCAGVHRLADTIGADSGRRDGHCTDIRSIAAIAFGLINHDAALCREGVVSILILFGISLTVCLLTIWGIAAFALAPINREIVTNKMITERLTVGGYSVLVAIIAGGAGVLAAASNRLLTTVGVSIALSLVPALAAASIGFIFIHAPSGWGGIALFGVNVVGTVLAGTLVLLLHRRIH